eukprot:6910768-Prymnesium_polylepis.1
MRPQLTWGLKRNKAAKQRSEYISRSGNISAATFSHRNKRRDGRDTEEYWSANWGTGPARASSSRAEGPCGLGRDGHHDIVAACS